MIKNNKNIKTVKGLTGIDEIPPYSTNPKPQKPTPPPSQLIKEGQNPYSENKNMKPKKLPVIKYPMHRNFQNDDEYMPNQKWHRYVSFLKSGVRIIGYGFIPFNLGVATILLILSEVIGIIEELV